jgi:hypothetical protein
MISIAVASVLILIIANLEFIKKIWAASFGPGEDEENCILLNTSVSQYESNAPTTSILDTSAIISSKVLDGTGNSIPACNDIDGGKPKREEQEKGESYQELNEVEDHCDQSKLDYDTGRNKTRTYSGNIHIPLEDGDQDVEVFVTPSVAEKELAPPSTLKLKSGLVLSKGGASYDQREETISRTYETKLDKSESLPSTIQKSAFVEELSIPERSSSPIIPSASSVSDQVEAFYRTHNPAKLKDVPYILQKYAGREDDLLAKLKYQYGVPDSSSYEERLKTFYKRYKPENVIKVPDILQKYKGKEKELFDHLQKLYKSDPL